MRGKLTTKTIIIAIVAILVLAIAVTGTVIFFKDSGEAAASGDTQNVSTLGQITDDNENKNENNNENNNENINIEDEDNENSENNSEQLNNDENLQEQSNSNGNLYNNQTEPEPMTIEREKIISETTVLGWNNIGFYSQIYAGNFNISYNNLEYEVRYYFDGTLDEKLTVLYSGNSKGKLINTYEDKIKVGYKLDKIENLPLKIKENEKENIIKVFYTKDDKQTKTLKYTVKYFLDNVEQKTDKVERTKTVWVNAEETLEFDDTLLGKDYVGYKKVRTNPRTVGRTVRNGDIIEVYYEKDDKQTKTLKYTVKYFLDNVEQKTDKVERTKTVWVNAEETLEFDNTLLRKDYVGYKKVKTIPTSVGRTVRNGDIIKVYYEKDDTQTKTLKYTVKYFLDNKEQRTDKVERTKTVWVNAEETLEFDDTLLGKDYAGYKKVKTIPTSVGRIVNNGDIIEVYYEKDDKQTKTLKYTVKYFLDNVEQKTDKVERTKTVWVNAEETLEFDDTLLGKDYVGYKKVRTNPRTVGRTVNNGDIIEVYFEKDDKQTKTLKYTVKYFLDNVEQKTDKVEKTKTVWVNAEETLEFDDTLLGKDYVGYKKVRTNPGTVGRTVNNGDIIKVYYEKDDKQTKTLKYTVKYFLDNVEQKTDKVEKTKAVWINAEDTLEFDDTLLGKDYVGYKKVRTNPGTVGRTVNNGDIIEVYYEKDDTQTKTLKYTVRYYLNNVEQITDKVEKTKKVWINSEENEIEFDNTLLNKEYTGYKKVDVTPDSIGTTVKNGTEIKVYYLKPANIIVSKTGQVVGKTTPAEKGDSIKYTITARNTGEETGTVTIKDVNLKKYIDNNEIEFISKTGYSGTNQELIDGLAGKGISLKVNGGENKQITYTVKVLAKVGTTIINKVEVIDGGSVDKDKESVENKIEKTANITEYKEIVKGKNIILIMDASESVRKNFEIEKKAICKFIDLIFPTAEETDNSKVTVLKYSLDNAFLVGRADNYNIAQNLKEKVNDVLVAGGSNTAEALQLAYDKYITNNGINENIVIYMGDGIILNTYYNKVKNIAPKLKQKATVYTIGLDVPTSGMYAERANEMLKTTIPTSLSHYFPSAYENNLIEETFKNIKKHITKNNYTKQSNNAKIQLSNTIYVDEEHPFIVKVNGSDDIILKTLPTNATGKVIKEGSKYYLDLTKFGADDKITITYFSK